MSTVTLPKPDLKTLGKHLPEAARLLSNECKKGKHHVAEKIAVCILADSGSPSGLVLLFNPKSLVVVDSTRDQRKVKPENVGGGEVWYDARAGVWKKICHSDRSAVEIGAVPLPLVDHIDYWEYIMNHPSHSDVMRDEDIHANGQEALRFLAVSSLGKGAMHPTQLRDLTRN